MKKKKKQKNKKQNNNNNNKKTKLQQQQVIMPESIFINTLIQIRFFSIFPSIFLLSYVAFIFLFNTLFFFVNDKNVLGIGKTWPEGFQISLDIVVYYAVFTPFEWIPFGFRHKKWIPSQKCVPLYL